jgi:hypothetical protein
MIFINGVAFEKVGSQIWIVSCTAPPYRTYTIVSAERQYLCSTYFGYTVPIHEIARQPGEARARLPVRALPGCLAILCIGTVYLRNCYQ